MVFATRARAHKTHAHLRVMHDLWQTYWRQNYLVAVRRSHAHTTEPKTDTDALASTHTVQITLVLALACPFQWENGKECAAQILRRV